MIKIKSLVVKNFMSIGNASQAVDFDRDDLTLVLGENLDLGSNGARNGTGKAQPLYSKIKTPGGWATMGDMVVGQAITTPTGGSAEVSGVFPQGEVETYRIHFSDGRQTDACKDHLWKVYSHSFKDKWQVLTTAELISHTEKYKNHKNKSTYYKYVPLIIPENIADIKLPFDPYFLGAMLGDGGMTVHGIGFTTADDEMFENMKQVLPENYQITKNHYDDYGYSLKFINRKKYSTLRLGLSALKLYGTKSATKFIPEIYKNASINQKIELIQGIVDTDGYVAKKNGSLSITTVSKQMADDIQEIIQSIGGIAKIKIKTNCGYKKDGIFIPCQDAYTVCITYHTPKLLARLSRKKDLLPGENYQYKNRKLRIDHIEYIGKIESQCIMVEHSDHLYITDNYIVTHNTTLINALSYGLYGSALSEIRVNNLVNKTNRKNMLVSVEFSIDEAQYRIERGRSPNVLKFYKNDLEQKDEDGAQGENRETQKEINDLLGLSHAMFKHAVALNTYTTPFLSLKNADQKDIIEELLGITVLTEKAEALKAVNKITKDGVKEEEFRLETIMKANLRIDEQIEGLKRRQRMWQISHNNTVDGYTSKIEKLMVVDIEDEIAKHNRNAKIRVDTDKKNTKGKAAVDKFNAELKIQKDREIAAIDKFNSAVLECNRWIKQIENDTKAQERRSQALQRDIDLLEDHKCHACGQDLHDETQEANIAAKKTELTECAMQILSNQTQDTEQKLKLADLGSPPVTKEAKKAKTFKEEQYKGNLTFYKTIDEAHGHKSSLATLTSQLETAVDTADPYVEQVDEMVASGLVEVSYESLNQLVELQEHQAFLLKLLTSKDSFIRKKIIEQNLAYLNGRLTYYLTEIGLPHRVRFMSDLSVEITDLGRDLDFDNLSRGERTRLILSLSWAFRDVWESLYSHINLLFVDELVDNGLDTNGVEAAIKIMKSMARERGKSVWLVSHREELISRVNNTMKVIKSGGYTEYSSELE